MTAYLNPFILLALLSAALASIASGIVGTFVVVKRIVFIGGGISHAILGGIGLFIYLNSKFHLPCFSPLYGALFAGLASAAIMGWIYTKHKDREDSAIAAIWALGMSVGIIFASQTPGYNIELLNYLFGNILWANQNDALLLFILDLFLILITYRFRHSFVAICFNEKQASLQGLPVKKIYFLLLAMVAVTIVLLIQIIGAILLIAFLCTPAAIASRFTKSVFSLMVVATLFCLSFSFLGTFFALQFNWPLGATIATLSTSTYFLSLLIKET